MVQISVDQYKLALILTASVRFIAILYWRADFELDLQRYSVLASESALPSHEKAGRCQPVFWVVDDRYPDSAVDEDFKSTVNLLWRAFLLPSLFRIALCILLLAGSDFVRAQQSQPTRLDLSVTYIGGHTLKSDTSENFWVQGGSIELGANIVHGWSIVANTQQPANVDRFCRWCGGCRGTPDRAGCCPRRNRSTLGQLPAQRS